MVVSPVRAPARAEVFQSSLSGPTCRWQSMSPGNTSLPVASITRSAGGAHCSGAMATIRPWLMATDASTLSVAVTTRPPRTRRSTRRTLMGARSARPARAVGGLHETGVASSMCLLVGHGSEQPRVVLGLAAAEEVPALAHGRHLLEVDARHDELVARGRGPGDDLAERVDHAAAADELHTVLDAGLGDADHEAGVGVGAGAQAEIVEVQRERGDRRVVADQDDLGALQRQRAVALGIPPVLADGHAHLRARAVPDAIARVAVGEVVGLVDLGEAVGGLRAGQVDLAERAAQPPVAVGEQRGVPVLAVRLLAEADVHGDPLLGGPPQQRLERLGRHLRLEELVEVAADLLREVRR